MKIILYNPMDVPQALERARSYAKAKLMSNKRMVIEVKEATRTVEANARLHATIADVAEQVQWAGQYRDVETWKRLLVAAWLRARGEHTEWLPALDGCGVDVVFRKTSTLTGRECSELCEYIYSWGVENGVRFSCPEEVVA